MNKRVKRKWINALRSGKYKKTTGYLHTKLVKIKNKGKSNEKKEEIPMFCSLGVLCDLYIKEQNKKIGKKEFEWDEVDTEDNSLIFGINEKSDSLPDEIVKWAELEDEIGAFEYVKNGDSENIVDLNDNQKKSFKQIANIIEKNL